MHIYSASSSTLPLILFTIILISSSSSFLCPKSTQLSFHFRLACGYDLLSYERLKYVNIVSFLFHIWVVPWLGCLLLH